MKSSDSPRIVLSVDSCFASKRWPEAQDWAKIVSDCGVRYVEVSADSDLDPLYTDPSLYAERMKNLRLLFDDCGLSASCFYSGHGTYSMSGFGSPDKAQRRFLAERWLLPFAKSASRMGAGVGWYFQSIPENALNDPIKFGGAKTYIEDAVRKAAALVREAGCSFAAVEQMYSPSQIPWTIDGTLDFIRQTGAYTTLDTGHQTGQRHFLRPDRETLAAGLHGKSSPYVGTSNAANLYRLAKSGVTGGNSPDDLLRRVEEDMDVHPYLFAREEDGDLCRWLEALGRWSPVIHLQQTDGRASLHRPFTQTTARDGIVIPEKVLRALKRAFDAPELPGMPPRVSEIHLTLELFFPLTQPSYSVIEELKASVRLWRQFIPEDGLSLDDLISRIPAENRKETAR